MSESGMKARHYNHRSYKSVVGYLILAKISWGYISSRLVGSVMTITTQFPTVLLFLAHFRHETKIVEERDFRSKNISQLEQHAHYWWILDA